MTLYDIIKRMIASGRDLNSLAKGHVQFDWNTDVSLEKLVKKDLKSRKEFWFLFHVHSEHYLYENDDMTELTTDGVEDYSVILGFINKRKARTEKGDEVDSDYPSTNNSDCYVFCNCPHFYYYYKHADKNILVPDSIVKSFGVRDWDQIDPLKGSVRKRDYSPKTAKNPNNDIGICKHIVSCVYYLLGSLDNNQNEEFRIGTDEQSIMLDDDANVVDILDKYNINVPLYAGNAEQKKQYNIDHMLKMTAKEFKKAVIDLERSKNKRQNVSKQIQTKRKVISNLSIEIDSLNTDIKTAKQSLKNKLAQIKKFISIDANGNKEYHPTDKVSEKKIKKAEDMISKMKSNLEKKQNKLETAQYNKYKRSQELQSLVDYVDSETGKLERKVINYKKRAERIAAQSKQNALHWYDNSKNVAVDNRQEPNGDSNAKASDIDKFIYNLNRDIRWYNHVIDNNMPNNKFSPEEIEKAKKNKERAEKLIDKWTDIRKEKAEKRALFADINKKNRESGHKRKLVKDRIKSLDNSVTSLMTDLDKKKGAIDSRINNLITTIKSKKELKGDKLDIDAIEKTIKDKVKEIKDSQKKLLADIDESDFFDKDVKEEKKQRINRIVDERINNHYAKLGVLKTFLKAYNEIIEKGKDAIKEPYIKQIVMGVDKKFNPKVYKSVSNVAASKDENNTANKNSSKNKKDAQRNLQKKASDKKKEKKRADIADKEALPEYKTARQDILNDLSSLSDKLADDLIKVYGIKKNSQTLDWLSKNKPLNIISASLAKKLIDNKKEGKGFDLKSAIKNNGAVFMKFCDAVMRRTGHSKDFVRDFVNNNIDKHD